MHDCNYKSAYLTYPNILFMLA